jgi:hypothetical protein
MKAPAKPHLTLHDYRAIRRAYEGKCDESAWPSDCGDSCDCTLEALLEHGACPRREPMRWFNERPGDAIVVPDVVEAHLERMHAKENEEIEAELAELPVIVVDTSEAVRGAGALGLVLGGLVLCVLGAIAWGAWR